MFRTCNAAAAAAAAAGVPSQDVCSYTHLLLEQAALVHGPSLLVENYKISC
jgi:hypothetical protein